MLRSAGCWSARCAPAAWCRAPSMPPSRRWSRCATTCPDVLLTDIRMSGKLRASTCCARCATRIPTLPVIVMTAHSDLPQRGVSLRGRRVRIPAQALRHRPGRGPGAARRRRPRAAATRRRRSRRRCPELLGKAPAMQQVFRAIGRLSRSSVDGADHRRIRHRQGTGGARAA